MRITNKMMTNNMLTNINRNKLNMTNLEQQYSTGKKIQRPSDDPIITVRALRLRTNITEIEQYYEKNIPDAMNWMDITESALRTVNELLSQINKYCVQGSNDTLTADNRSAITANLKQLGEQINQEGNTNFAGRYVFTGYKTDSPLIFTDASDKQRYSITEQFSGEQIQIEKKVIGSYDLTDYDDPTITFNQAPQYKDIYRLQLSYDELNNTPIDRISYTTLDAAGNPVNHEITNVTTVSLENKSAYSPAPGEAYVIYETGEVILSEDLYNSTLKNAETIELTYEKTKFDNGDLRPEHYFNCTMTDLDKPMPNQVTFTKSVQKINYEVNYNQELTINTEGSDAILHSIGRLIDDINASVEDVKLTESKIEQINKKLKDTNLTDDERKRYEDMLEQFDTELTLKKEIMQKAFEGGIKISNTEQNRVNVALADLGSRYVRLELTENRLSNQKIDFEELLSKNEDADIVDTIIKYNSAQTLYNASLTAASKIVQNSLLNFL